MPHSLQAKDPWNAGLYAQHCHYVAASAGPLLELLNAQPGEVILDLGCGDGQLSRELQALGCEVMSIDASPNMVASAHRHGVAAVVMDAHELTFDDHFDAVLSNAALHWMKQPAQVLSGVKRSLRSGGRFVAEMGAGDNIKTIREGLTQALNEYGLEFTDRTPWFFPTQSAYQRMLEDQGFIVSSIQLLEYLTPLPTDLKGWLDTFSDLILFDLSPSQREGIMASTLRYCAPVLQNEEGSWFVDYVRLRFRTEVGW